VNSIISWCRWQASPEKEDTATHPKHDIYCEVFGGAAWTLFGKSPNKEDWQISKKSRYTEVYNDINGALVNFWRYIKQHPEAFVTELNQYLVSREMFDTFTQHEPRTSWNELSVSISSYPAATAHGQRLLHYAGLKIHAPAESGEGESSLGKATAGDNRKADFEKIIARFDTPNTFFYLDPPYFTKEHLYDREDANAFTKHEELAAHEEHQREVPVILQQRPFHPHTLPRLHH
jgi:DNA adenine methylase